MFFYSKQLWFLSHLCRCKSTCCRLSSKSTGFKRAMSSSLGQDHLDRTATNSRSKVTSQAVVRKIENLSSSVKLLKLHVNEKNFSFKAGQWVDMLIPGVETVGGFSMSSPPHLLTETSTLHLSVKFSTHPPAYWVHTKCQVGSTVGLRVGGDFFYNPTRESGAKDLLLLAGGVGINPLFSMLQHFVHHQKDMAESAGVKKGSACLLYSAKNGEELIFKDQLLDIARSRANINVKLFTSREISKNADSIMNKRIELNDIQLAVSKLKAGACDVYLCGPLSFIETMKGYCLSSSIPLENLHYERWW